MSKIINGKPFVLSTEALTGIPTTAHILGGAVIGNSPETGVIDLNQKYLGMKICMFVMVQQYRLIRVLILHLQ